MLSTIASLAESGDMQAILDFIGIADQSPDMPEAFRYCRDPLLDTTLCSYLKSAEESSILLQLSLAIPFSDFCNKIQIDGAYKMEIQQDDKQIDEQAHQNI